MCTEGEKKLHCCLKDKLKVGHEMLTSPFSEHLQKNVPPVCSSELFLVKMFPTSRVQRRDGNVSSFCKCTKYITLSAFPLELVGEISQTSGSPFCCSRWKRSNADAHVPWVFLDRFILGGRKLTVEWKIIQAFNWNSLSTPCHVSVHIFKHLYNLTSMVAVLSNHEALLVYFFFMLIPPTDLFCTWKIRKRDGTRSCCSYGSNTGPFPFQHWMHEETWMCPLSLNVYTFNWRFWKNTFVSNISLPTSVFAWL